MTVTPVQLRRYIEHRQQQGAAPATINRETEANARAFALAVESGMLLTAPKVPSLLEYNARQGFFERGEFEAILQRLPDDGVKDFCEWAYLTGMRPGEIRSLTWANLDQEAWTLRLHASGAKTGFGRAIPLGERLQAIVQRRIADREIACPFVFQRGGHAMGDFRKTWKRVCQARSGATSERSRPGRGRACTRRGNPSALPEGTRQPCWRSSARMREMYRVPGSAPAHPGP